MLQVGKCAFVDMAPVEVFSGNVVPHLSVRDLQALDTAFTNKYLRPRWKDVLTSIHYACGKYGKMDFADVKWLHEHGVRITSITLFHTPLQDVVTFICAHIKTLRKLKLVGSYSDISTDSMLQQLAYGCPQLEVLHIPLADDISVGIAALGQQCRNLHTVSLSQNSISEAVIQIMCGNCPNLKHIDLSSSYLLTDVSLIAIANTYPHLQTINIFHCNFTNDGLIYFADKCHELRSVAIQCRRIRSRGLAALWAANPNLMDVDISLNEFISDDYIIQLAQCCPLLQKLNMSHCYGITDAAVIAVAEHCPQLRSLNICYCNDLSDASLIALGQHCHTLKSIDISNVKNISDVGISALAAGCPLLQEFYASDASITDAGVVALARGCRDLLKLYCRECVYLGVASVSAIAENCPLISKLSLPSCNIDDACLYVIAQHCRNLSFLDVSSSKIIEADAIRSVLESCSLLTNIIIGNCRKLRDRESIRNLLKKCVRITGLLNVH